MDPNAAGPSLDELAAAVAALGRGQVVAYPTETFYGLGVDALEETALARLVALKGRESTKAVSLLVSDEAMVLELVTELPARARELMAAHWPGPLTIALPARPGLPALLVSDGCVAVRVSAHPVARALVERLGRPITATSANPGGAPPARAAAGVATYFGGRCLIVDGGTAPGGLASTLVRVRGTTLEVLRHGPVLLD